MAKAKRETGARRNGVQSIEVGWQLLEALTHSNGPLHLGELANGARMATSKARRYLVSLLRCGLVEQSVTTGRYDLGPMSLRLGLTTMNRQDAVRFATEASIDLNQEIDRTVLLSIWTERGPTIIAWYDSTERVICNLYVGSLLPLLRSVSGRLFLSYLPRQTTRDLLAREMQSDFVRDHLKIRSDSDISRIVEGIRSDGMARTEELLIPGLNAMGAAFFDHQGEIKGTVVLIGPPGSLRTNGPHRDDEAVKRKADEISRRLGFRGQIPGGSLIEWTESRTGGPMAADLPALAPTAKSARTTRGKK